MSTRKRKYELSVWLSANEDGSKGETKLAVIGSSQNTSPFYAYDIHYVPNINGEKRLTFSINYLAPIFDGKRQQLVDNPFCQFLSNEAKVKLFFLDEWNEFTIRNQSKNKQAHTITYEAEESNVLELSKTGYGLEFSADLYNNTDTAINLAKKVVEGTDWTVSDESDIQTQYSAEPIYQLTLNQDVTFRRMDTGSALALERGETIYGFYSTLTSKDPYFQMLFIPDFSEFEINEDNVALNTTNYFLENVQYKENGTIPIPTFCDGGALYERCRARKVVRKQEVKYEPLLEEVVSLYEGQDGERYCGYEQVNYTVDDIVTNYFTNSKDFIMDSNSIQATGWSTASGSNIAKSVVLPNSTVQMTTPDYAAYIELAQGTYINSGLVDHVTALPDTGFVENDKYVFRAQVGVQSGDIVTANLSKTDLSVALAWYSVDSVQLDRNKIVFETKIDTDDTVYPYGYTTNDDGSYSPTELTSFYNQPRYAYGVGQFKETVTKEELITGKDFEQKRHRLGMFVIVGEETLFIKDIQFFKYIASAHSNYPIVPGAQNDLAKVETTKLFYKEFDENEVFSRNEIIYSGEDETFFTPVYDNKFQKKKTITASKTNRFDILQSICEAFEVWIKFEVAHDKNGYIQYVGEGDERRPDKKIVIKNDVGDFKGFGFRYGRDIQDITREVNSEELVSKVYVEDIDTQTANGTVCSIQKATYNPTGERFIYDFSYYIDQGLINAGALNSDLYDNQNGLYVKIKKIMNDFRAQEDRYTHIANEIIKAKSNREVYNQYVVEATKQYDKAKVSFESVVQGSIDTYPLSMTDSQEARNYYARAMYAKQRIAESSEYAKNYTAICDKLEEEEHQLTWELVDLTNPNSLASQKRKLIKDFETKYSNFIQEGTWQADDYIDSELYYLTAQSVARTSARPKVSYTLDVLALSSLPKYRHLAYNVGDIVTVEDEEYFGYAISDSGIRAPKKEKVVISEIDYALTQANEDKITVQNYKTKFESLFSRISAMTKQLEYNQRAYGQAADSFNADGSINEMVMERTFANGVIEYATPNQTLKLDGSGITLSVPKNTKKLVRIDASGIFTSDDGGRTWGAALTSSGISTDQLTAGVIDASNINIKSGDRDAFKWNENGIHAFSNGQGSELDYNTYVRMDRFGLYGVQVGPKAETTDASGKTVLSDASSWVPKNTQEIFDTATFGFTWDGFFIKNKYNNGYVEIGSNSDIRIVETNSDGTNPRERLVIGALERSEEDPSTVTNFGISLMDKSGNMVFHTDESGNLTVTGTIEARDGHIGSMRVDNQTLVMKNIVLEPGFGIYALNNEDGSIPTDSTGAILNPQAYKTSGKRRFLLSDVDGSLRATDAYLKGEIEAEYGRFIGQMVVGQKPKTSADLPNTPGIIINGGTGYDIFGNPLTKATGLNNPYIGTTNFNASTGTGWRILNNGDAIFNNITARGAIHTAVFEYSEVQAVGGALLVRPSSTIKSFEESGNNLIVKVEHPEVFKNGEIVKVSTYQANNGTVGALDGLGLLHKYKIQKTVRDGVEYIVLLDANRAPTESNPRTLRGVTDLAGGSLVSYGALRGSSPQWEIDNYGIGINSGDDDFGLPARSISLFNIDNVESGNNIDSSYNFQAIIGVLPDVGLTNRFYKDYLQGKNGIYTKNMYIGNDTSYLSFDEETGKMRISVDELEVTSGLDSRYEAYIIMEKTASNIELKGVLYDTQTNTKITNTAYPNKVTYTWYKGDDPTPVQSSKNDTLLIGLNETNYNVYTVVIDFEE